MPTRIAIKDIVISGRLRPINRKVVDALVVSMGDPGNHVPPIIVRPDPDHHRWILVAGAHRLEAAWNRRDEDIFAVIFDGTEEEARILEIKENYDRADLTALERSKHRAELALLTGQKVPNIGHPGRPQPHDKGISKTAVETGVSRQQIQRDIKIASITPEAQAAAADAGLANNQSALIAIAEVPADDQVKKVKEIADRPKRTRRPAEEMAAEGQLEIVAANREPSEENGLERQAEKEVENERRAREAGLIDRIVHVFNSQPDRQEYAEAFKGYGKDIDLDRVAERWRETNPELFPWDDIDDADVNTGRETAAEGAMR